MAPMTQSGPDAPAAHPADAPAFPPDSIEAFLRFCAGEWMSLRSRFELDGSSGDSTSVESGSGGSGSEAGEAGAGDGDEWHSSERGELVVAYLEPADGGPGGLSVGPKGEPQRPLLFNGDGTFTAGDQQGTWTLWPDGSLELVLSAGEAEVRERIWFTKPNLRLRATLESTGDGSPSRASFCSEIRRVSRPAAAGPGAAS
jgi:hypothetical protein